MTTKFIDSGSGKEIEIDRTIPSHQQEWRKRLVLVSSPPTRFVGYLPEGVDVSKPGSFTLQNVLIYFCNIAVQMVEPGKLNLSAMPQVLVGYDLMMPLNSVIIGEYQHVVFIHDQMDETREWFESRYLDAFDSPRVVLEKIIR